MRHAVGLVIMLTFAVFLLWWSLALRDKEPKFYSLISVVSTMLLIVTFVTAYDEYPWLFKMR